MGNGLCVTKRQLSSDGITWPVWATKSIAYPSTFAQVVANNPKFNCGKGCVRIRDTQEVPIEDVVDVYRRAMGLAIETA